MSSRKLSIHGKWKTHWEKLLVSWWTSLIPRPIWTGSGMRLMIDNLPIVKSATLNSRFCKHLGVHFKSVSSKHSVSSGWNLLWCNHGDVDIEGSWLRRVKSNYVDGNWHQILQQTGRKGERERTKKKGSNTVEQYLRQWAHILQASSFSFLGSSPACVMPGRS